jgi:hypothetical protein
MPTIITRGLGNDTPIIIQRIIASELVGTVVARSPVEAVVTVEESPTATVLPKIQVFGTVFAEDKIQGVVVTSQPVIGVLVEEGPCMSIATNKVTMFIRDDRTLEVSVNANTSPQTPQDLTGAKVWMTVKDRTSDLDSSAHIMKRNAAAGGSDSEIKILTPATNGQLEIYLVPADTENMNPGTYVYDVQVKLANDKVYTVVRSQITFKDDVTRTDA